MPGPRPGRLRSLFLMTAWMGWLTTAMAFKTGDFPIEMINSNNSTVTQLANKAIADNMAYDIKQMNSIPDPALNKTRENETGENANETGENANETDAEGLGGLGRTLEFLMLKVTQLETLCELQQAKIVSLEKTVKELLQIPEHLDADHKDSQVTLLQTDPAAHMQEGDIGGPPTADLA
ncbi:unnamed protein product [Symbiodinium natans]|uniref:Uncharacterized protein n=1 Tax=Symbiodinium natans TaxID=878477 RepID=A0A812K6L4_9DINO|nr:unnamed protein product [Symbiodinium natans]